MDIISKASKLFKQKSIVTLNENLDPSDIMVLCEWVMSDQVVLNEFMDQGCYPNLIQLDFGPFPRDPSALFELNTTTEATLFELNTTTEAALFELNTPTEAALFELNATDKSLVMELNPNNETSLLHSTLELNPSTLNHSQARLGKRSRGQSQDEQLNPLQRSKLKTLLQEIQAKGALGLERYKLTQEALPILQQLDDQIVQTGLHYPVYVAQDHSSEWKILVPVDNQEPKSMSNLVWNSIHGDENTCFKQNLIECVFQEILTSPGITFNTLYKKLSLLMNRFELDTLCQSLLTAQRITTEQYTQSRTMTSIMDGLFSRDVFPHTGPGQYSLDDPNTITYFWPSTHWLGFL